MASMTMQIERPQPRPCVWDGKRALFHGFSAHAWTHGAALNVGGFSAGQEFHPLAIIELEDGSIRTPHPSDIRFLDSAQEFKSVGAVSTSEDAKFWLGKGVGLVEDRGGVEDGD